MSKSFVAHLDDPSHPFLICDNWYTPEEENMVWKELDYYTNVSTLFLAEEGPVATDAEGEPLASNFRIYPESIYTHEHRYMSAILSCASSKLTDPDLKSFIFDNMRPGPFNCHNGSNNINTLISYYHNGDYYKAHHDAFQFTALIWFYKEPKPWTGGDFHFTDGKIIVPCVHNRMIMFPSYLNHAVTQLEFHDDDPLGSGRYTMTHFIYTTPSGEIKGKLKND